LREGFSPCGLVTRELRKMGWSVVRVWEHELQNPEKVVAKLKKVLGKGESAY
jgi:very-short-patch-repair endonuclease